MILGTAALLTLQITAPYTIQPVFKPSRMEDYSDCYRINDKSQVLCAEVPSMMGTGIGLVWQDGKVTPLPMPEARPGEVTSVSGLSLSNNGTVVGEFSREMGNAPATEDYYFRWNPVDGWDKIVTGTEYQFCPDAINSNEELAGIQFNGDGHSYTSYGKVDGGFHFVPGMPAGFQEPNDINDKGEMVTTTTSAEVCYRVRPGSPPEALQTPPNPYGFNSSHVVARAINNNGYAVGYVEMGSAHHPKPEGIIWAPDGSYTLLGVGTRAFSINDRGQVVGAYAELLQHRPRADDWYVVNGRAFIYDPKFGIKYLDMTLPFGSPTLSNASDINNEGQIVCHGTDGVFYIARPNN